MKINEYDEKLTDEKERVKAYVGTLQSLDNPFSDDIGLLPGELAGKAEKYFEYERILAEPILEKKRTPEEVQVLRDDCRMAFNDYRTALTDLLARHGYTFGEPDSLNRNLNQRLTDLMEDYHALEGPEADPMLVDYTYRTPVIQKMRNVAEYKEMTAQLYGKRIRTDGKPSFKMDGGMEELRNKVRTQQAGDNMQITQINSVYGAVYEIAVTEELAARVTVDADSRQEAAGKVQAMIDNEELVLDADDYVGVTFGSLQMDGVCDPNRNRPYVEEGPDGKYTVRVTEYLETVVKQEGVSRDDAEDSVRSAYEDEEIVLGADELTHRDIDPAYHITNDRLLEPEPVELMDAERIRRWMCAERVTGMHIRFNDESVDSLLQTASKRDTDMSGVICKPESDIIWDSPKGTLRVEADLQVPDYVDIYPDIDRYRNKEWDKQMPVDTNAYTNYYHQHPRFDGGQVTVRPSMNILESLRVEGVPFRDAIQIIADNQITDDRQFKEAAGVYRRQHGLEASQSLSDARKMKMPGLERVSEISVMRPANNKAAIRCKIDGVQQMAVPLSSKDRILLFNEMTTKEELAMKYFQEELGQDRSQKQSQGLRR